MAVIKIKAKSTGGNFAGKGKEDEKQGHLGISGQVEGSAYRGCHVGRRAGSSAPKSEVA